MTKARVVDRERLRGLATSLAVAVAAALYLLQHVRMTPNHVDGGLLLSYVARVAAGQRPFVDFVDVYGPWTWPPLAAGFQLFGERVIGARLALWTLKLICLALNYAVVRRAAGHTWAACSAIGLCILLGVPWQLAQDPYPYAQALACELGCLYLWLYGSSRRALWLAGALTAAALLTKLNTGALLLCSGSILCLYARGAEPRAPHPLWRAWGFAGLVALVLATDAIVTPHLAPAFLAYLVAPVLVLAVELGTRSELGPSRTRALALSHYLLAALVSFGVGLGLSIGFARVPEYLAFQASLLGRLHYAASPLPIGAPGAYIGFNEHGWTLLPWLVTALYGAYAWTIRNRPTRPIDRAVQAAFAVFTLHQFVIYSRSDEAHVYQALLLAPATLALTLHAWTDELHRSSPGLARWPGRLAAALLLAGVLDLGSVAGLKADTAPAWSGARMSGIRYREPVNRHVRAAITHMTERDEDAAVDRAAQHLRARLRPEDRVLALNRNTLLDFAAGATVTGDRHAYLLYLLRNGFLDRAGFEALAPPGFVQRIRNELPRFVIGSIGTTELEHALPGLGLWVLRYYQRAQVFGPLLVYERRPDAIPPPQPRLP